MSKQLSYPELLEKFIHLFGGFFVECNLVLGAMMYATWAMLLLIGHAGGLGKEMAIWGLQMGIVGSGYMVAMPLIRLLELKLPLRAGHFVVLTFGLFALPFLLLDMSKPGVSMNWWLVAIPPVMAIACVVLRYRQYQKGRQAVASH